MKKLAKFIAIGMLIIICLGLFTGCSDCRYNFHFDVDGGNGEITLENGEITLENEYFLKIVNLCNEGAGCELECPNNSHIVSRLGGKKGYHKLTFVAIPDEGYQVKEWLFSGEIVDGNKTNSYTAKVTCEHYNVIITVRFEPIPSN